MKKNKITIGKLALYIDSSVLTISNWYEWYLDDKYKKPEGLPELPMYEQNRKGGTRYWNIEDIEKIKIFKEWLPKGRGGVMGDFNAKYWGEKGKQALENKKNKRWKS